MPDRCLIADGAGDAITPTGRESHCIFSPCTDTTVHHLHFDLRPLGLLMLHLVTLLITASLVLGKLSVIDVHGTFHPGDKLTVDWTSNAADDPTQFNIVLYSQTFNSNTFLARNVNRLANQLAVQLPTLPPSNDYIIWLENVADSTDVYGNSNLITIVAAATTTPATTSTPTTTQAQATTAVVTVVTTSIDVEHPSTPTTTPTTTASTSSAKDFTTSIRASSPAQSSDSAAGSSGGGIDSPIINSSPSMPSSSSSPAPQGFQTQVAAPVSSKAMSAGSVAGIVIGVLFVLLASLLIWLCLRRAQRKRPLDGDTQPYPHGEPERPLPEFLLVRREKSGHAGAVQIPQETPVAQLREMQAQLQLLPTNSGDSDADADLVRQNEALRARIRELESQTSDGYGYEADESPPPAYLDQRRD
ncbi:hypothetical protein DFH06DRAFT_392007 [Mycena polygramma]|nr:hypothetical protein DFH06DRAFT_392007 [Mycena polygramma]